MVRHESAKLRFPSSNLGVASNFCKSTSQEVLLQINIIAYGSIAQLGEHLPYKQRVIGSSPIVPTKRVKVSSLCPFYYADVAHLVERHLAKVEVAGSSPVIRSSKRPFVI